MLIQYIPKGLSNVTPCNVVCVSANLARLCGLATATPRTIDQHETIETLSVDHIAFFVLFTHLSQTLEYMCKERLVLVVMVLVSCAM